MALKCFRVKGVGRKGFSLVELSVVVIIIGVLAAFGIPRMLKSVERSKSAEAFKYLASVRAAQERYQAREGTYASDMSLLDMEQSAPKYFTVGAVAAGATASLEDSWTLTLTREGAAAGYGAYTVTFTEEGYDAVASTIEGLPDINPMGSSAAPPVP
jgi:prepilin-type N-terminal cleavage/methylation domain-containing protein